MLLFIIFVTKLITNCSSLRVTSLCGHPGLPPDSILYQVNTGRIRFQDGEEVRYLCNSNFQTHIQKRKCVSGRWVGETARCGVAIDNDIEIVKVYNCSDTNSTSDEILNLKINQSSNELSFVSSFHASRHKTGPITVYGSSCYLWQFKLKKPSMIPFLTLDFATQITSKDLKDGFIHINDSSSLRPDLLTIKPFVSHYRTCRLARKVDHINPDIDNNATYLLTAYHFRCDSISENDYISETQQIPGYLEIETRTNYPRDVNLVAVFMANHKIDAKTGRAECGKPETVRTGANFRQSSLGISQYQYQCNDSFTDVTPNRPINAKSAHWYSINCSANGLWVGQFPLCVPNVRCPGLEYLEKNKDPSVMIESIENVYYINETYWVAGEHSQVNYACVNSDHIVVGRLNRVCLKDGNWSHKMPRCTDYVDPESLSTVAQSPWTVIIILSSILIVFLVSVMLVVRKYVANVRRELTKNRDRSRLETSIYTDIRNNSMNYNYDDCNNTFSAVDRIDRVPTIGNVRINNSPEYIELEDSSKDPVYIPILPSTQQ